MKSWESGIGNRELGQQTNARSCALAAVVHSPFPIPHSRARKRASGFTLIELMAVIVLLAIATTAVTFSFSKSLQSARIRGASRDLVAALRYTRGQAIVKGKQEVLTLDLDNNTYTAPGKHAIKLPKDMSLRLTTAETEQTAANAGGIRFFADGSSTGGHITVLQGQREWRVNVAWLTGDIALDEQPER
ncbi:MAG: GspH/FimT family pseudopilin [Dokdonella sp.]